MPGPASQQGQGPLRTPQGSPSATSSPFQGTPVVVRRLSSLAEGKTPFAALSRHCGWFRRLAGGPRPSRPQTTFLQAKGSTPPSRVLLQLPTSIQRLGDGSPGVPRISAHPVRRGTDSPCPQLMFIQQAVFKMYSFPGAAITRPDKPGGLRQQPFMLSQGWSLEALDRGASRVLPRAVRASGPGFLPASG